MDDIGPQLWIEDCIGVFLFATVPLLFGLSRSFAHLRKRAIIEHAEPAILASTAVFSGLAVTFFGIIAIANHTSFNEAVIPAGICGVDCAIFWLFTRSTFKKMQKAQAAGFQVLIPLARKSPENM